MSLLTNAQRDLALAVMAVLALAVGCAGNKNKPDGLSQTTRDHFAQIDQDAHLVLSVNGLNERLDAIQESKAWQTVRGLLEDTRGGDPEIMEMFQTLDAVASVLDQHLQGRATLVLHEQAPLPGSPQTEDEVLLILDGDIQKLLQGFEALEDEAPGEVKPMGQEIYQYERSSGTSPQLYFHQHGGTGYLASSPSLLEGVQQGWKQKAVARSLGSSELFRDSVKELDPNSEVVLWGRDWTSADEDWGSLLGAGKEQPRPHPFVLTANLTGGVDAHLMIDVGDDFAQDPDLKDILPALTELSDPPAIPGILPAQVVGYAGLSLSMEKLLPMLTGMDGMEPNPMMPMPGDGAQQMLQTVGKELQGEFALVITEADPNGPRSIFLEGAVPDVALVARLTSPQSEQLLKPLFVQIFGILSQAQGGGMIQPGTTQQMGGGEAVIHSTLDPAIQVGYAFHPEGYLILGTRGAIKSILKLRGTPESATLAQGTGHDTITGFMRDQSNYRLHLDLAALYNYLKAQFHDPLAMHSQGLLGGPKDPLDNLFSVFRFAGGSLRYEDQRLKARLYLTAKDL